MSAQILYQIVQTKTRTWLKWDFYGSPSACGTSLLFSSAGSHHPYISVWESRTDVVMQMWKLSQKGADQTLWNSLVSYLQFQERSQVQSCVFSVMDSITDCSARDWRHNRQILRERTEQSLCIHTVKYYTNIWNNDLAWSYSTKPAEENYVWYDPIFDWERKKDAVFGKNYLQVFIGGWWKINR
jgi:murein L,D-transpeptidase YcbB/YkuD